MPSRLLHTIFNMAGFARGKINRILCSDWLFEKAYGYLLGNYRFWFRKENNFSWPYEKVFIDEAFLSKLDRWWPRSFLCFLFGFKFVFVHRSVENKKVKKITRLICSHLDLTLALITHAYVNPSRGLNKITNHLRSRAK